MTALLIYIASIMAQPVFPMDPCGFCGQTYYRVDHWKTVGEWNKCRSMIWTIEQADAQNIHEQTFEGYAQ